MTSESVSDHHTNILEIAPKKNQLGKEKWARQGRAKGAAAAYTQNKSVC